MEKDVFSPFFSSEAGTRVMKHTIWEYGLPDVSYTWS